MVTESIEGIRVFAKFAFRALREGFYAVSLTFRVLKSLLYPYGVQDNVNIELS